VSYVSTQRARREYDPAMESTDPVCFRRDVVVYDEYYKRLIALMERGNQWLP